MAIITISRQFGTGGKTLGKLIAEKTGYSFFDHEIVQMISEKAGVSPKSIQALEEETTGNLMKQVAGSVPSSFVDRILAEKFQNFREEIYVDLLHKIIAKLADNGNVVLLGRAGQYILADRKNAFHLLLAAPDDARLAWVEKTHALTRAQAKDALDMEDRRRKRLYAKFNKDDFDNPKNYHMVLNMDKLSLDQALAQVLTLVAEQTES